MPRELTIDIHSKYVEDALALCPAQLAAGKDGLPAVGDDSGGSNQLLLFFGHDR